MQIISVAEYVKDSRVREAVRRSDNIRRRTIEKCYSISGYADLPRKVRNDVYDNVRVMIEKEKRKWIIQSRTRRSQMPTLSEA